MWEKIILDFFLSLTHSVSLSYRHLASSSAVANRYSGSKRSQRKMALLESYTNSEANLKNPNFVL